jgi:hypothetical protein
MIMTISFVTQSKHVNNRKVLKKEGFFHSFHKFLGRNMPQFSTSLVLLLAFVSTTAIAQLFPRHAHSHLANLTVQHVTVDWRHPQCPQGYYDKFVVIGRFEAFTVTKFEDVFRYNRNGCVAVVELHSVGGTYKSGRDLGNFFRKNNVQTVIPSWAICSSACANSFYGGVNRAVQAGGILAVHQPYRTIYSSGRDPRYACDRDLKHRTYLTKMLGEMVADRVFALENRHCGPDGAYLINSFEASQIGITN